MEKAPANATDAATFICSIMMGLCGIGCWDGFAESVCVQIFCSSYCGASDELVFLATSKHGSLVSFLSAQAHAELVHAFYTLIN